MENGNYFTINNLVVYQLAREYSQHGWKIYEPLTWQQRKIIGDQMITSIDSVGANIAEGYGRFHYLDKIKFYYNARGSLIESNHWIELLRERGVITQDDFIKASNLYREILLKLNLLIKSQFNQKSNT